LNGVAERHGLSLISDEVFSDYIFSNRTDICRTIVANNAVPTFVLGGLSKAMALPQMKLSWIAVNGPQRFVVEALSRLEVIADTFLSVNTPAQNAAAAWLAQADVIRGQVAERVSANYAVLQKAFASAAFGEVLPLEGGWYAVVSVPKLADGEAFALQLLKEKYVYLHPGYFFDFEEEGFLIVSLLPRAEVFRDGVNRLCEALVRLEK
jgi:aspartate/methionine/tyrosine aminotransferase